MRLPTMAQNPPQKQKEIAGAVKAQSAAPEQYFGIPVIQGMSQTMAQVYQGPTPPPEHLKAIESVIPGGADRMITLAEQEAAHRHIQESKTLEANIAAQQSHSRTVEAQTKNVFWSDILGQILGVVTCVLCIVAAGYLALHDKTAVALALCAIPSAAMVRAFFVKR